MKTQSQTGSIAASRGEDSVILHMLSGIFVIRRCFSKVSTLTLLSTLQTFLNIASFCEQLIYTFAQRLAVWMQRTLAPLRRIVSRELEVFEYDRIRKDLPQSFIINDHLECGHVEVCYSWDIFDLLNAYTTNPQVRAKRHRCKPCASLLADRKPVQPVRLAKAGAKKSPQFSWRMA